MVSPEVCPRSYFVFCYSKKLFWLVVGTVYGKMWNEDFRGTLNQTHWYTYVWWCNTTTMLEAGLCVWEGEKALALGGIPLGTGEIWLDDIDESYIERSDLEYILKENVQRSLSTFLIVKTFILAPSTIDCPCIEEKRCDFSGFLINQLHTTHGYDTYPIACVTTTAQRTLRVQLR